MSVRTDRECPECGEPLWRCEVSSGNFGGFSYLHIWCRADDCDYHEYKPDLDCFKTLEKEIPDRLRRDLEKITGQVKA